MNEILTQAMTLSKEMVEVRRHIHQHAEAGLDLPVTSAYVKQKLEDMGYEVQRIGTSGLTAIAGDSKKGKTILLRADMDALPMREESGLSFASATDAAHCCGHDMHTAMLLGAAKLIKTREPHLCGSVKFLFQPGEETEFGALRMLEHGILENPRPDAVLGLHVNAKAPAGRLDYGKGCTFSSSNNFDIEVIGRGGHAARPHETIDPIKVANYIYSALQTLRSSETKPMDPLIFTITAIHGGSSYNTISDTVTMKGTMRAYDEEVRQKALKRIVEICEGVAQTFHAKAEVKFTMGVPPLYCSPEFTDELLSYAAEVGLPVIASENEIKMGAEDFSFLTAEYPDTSGYLFLGAGPDEHSGFPYGQHSPKVVFNEEVMPYGAAVMAVCAMKWLQKHGDH
ncbi:MAG: M20 family metallopeptidase [Hungatella sp.]